MKLGAPMMMRCAVAVSILLVACGGGGDRAQIEKVRDAACACTTVKCIKDVKREHGELIDKVKKSEDLADVFKAMDGCARKVRDDDKDARAQDAAVVLAE